MSFSIEDLLEQEAKRHAKYLENISKINLIMAQLAARDVPQSILDSCGASVGYGTVAHWPNLKELVILRRVLGQFTVEGVHPEATSLRYHMSNKLVPGFEIHYLRSRKPDEVKLGPRCHIETQQVTFYTVVCEKPTGA